MLVLHTVNEVCPIRQLSSRRRTLFSLFGEPPMHPRYGRSSTCLTRAGKPIKWVDTTELVLLSHDLFSLFFSVSAFFVSPKSKATREDVPWYLTGSSLFLTVHNGRGQDPVVFAAKGRLNNKCKEVVRHVVRRFDATANGI